MKNTVKEVPYVGHLYQQTKDDYITTSTYYDKNPFTDLAKRDDVRVLKVLESYVLYQPEDSNPTDRKFCSKMRDFLRMYELK